MKNIIILLFQRKARFIMQPTVLFSLVKIRCYFHVWTYHVFGRKFTWYFTGVYVINIFLAIVLLHVHDMAFISFLPKLERWIFVPVKHKNSRKTSSFMQLKRLISVSKIYLTCSLFLLIFFQFPLPRPQGGRHSNNPVLTEDQPRGQHRLPRKKDNMNVFDPNYIARSSPFAAKDVTSRASQLGYHLKGAQDYQNRRNPNEVRKKSRRRKK